MMELLRDKRGGILIGDVVGLSKTLLALERPGQRLAAEIKAERQEVTWHDRWLLSVYLASFSLPLAEHTALLLRPLLPSAFSSKRRLECLTPGESSSLPPARKIRQVTTQKPAVAIAGLTSEGLFSRKLP